MADQSIKAGYLSTPNLVQKIGKVPGELLVLSLRWTLSGVSEGSNSNSTNRVNQLYGKREGQPRKRRIIFLGP